MFFESLARRRRRVVLLRLVARRDGFCALDWLLGLQLLKAQVL